MPLIQIEEELITRYLFSRRNFRSSSERVRYNAFMPKNREISVFRISGIEKTEKIWEIGNKEVAIPGNRELKGRADINSKYIKEQRLNIIPKEPPYRHANVTEWDSEKSKNILIAKTMAQKASVHVVS